MTKEKALYVITRLLKDELPLMTPNKCARTAKKVLGLLIEYKVITLTEENQSGNAEVTQLSKKS